LQHISTISKSLGDIEMLSLSSAETVIGSIQQGAGKSPRTKITRRHSEELARCSQDFGGLRAEVFSCRAQGMNELEVLADAHSVFLRCEGTASRFEVTWWDQKDHQKLSEFKPGWVVFSPASSSVRMIKKDHGDYRYISVYVLPSALDQLNDDELDARCLALPPQAGPCHADLCRVVLAMKDEMDKPGPVGNLYRTTLAVQLLIQLVRSTCHLTLPPAKGGLPAWRLRRVIEMLEADLTASPSISQLASIAGLSPAHFCTAFKQSTGYSPHRYLLIRRVAYAKELMADRRLSLTEVALTCGFGSSSHLATTFLRIDGVTPSAYRRSL
jgi:AraC family transcriptional regulator